MRLCTKLSGNKTLDIYDGFTKGLFFERIKEAGFEKPIKKYFIDQNPQAMNPENFSQVFHSEGADFHLGLFPHSSDSAMVVINGKREEINTYRDIPASSQLGKLVIIEKVFARGL